MLNVVILAAGQGKRMRSDLPKVLHRLGGRPLLAHVLDTARELDAKQAEMFALRYFEGYSNAEIARPFNISSVRVAVTLYRIRLKLQEEV